MRAGRLRHRVTLQQPSVTQNALGEAVETFADAATVWAAVEPVSGREYFGAAAERAQLTHQIRLRPYAGLDPTWRVTFGARSFDIETAINPDERGRELVLMCTERL